MSDPGGAIDGLARERLSATGLAEILAAHRAWREGGDPAARPADLRGIDLSGVALRNQDLQGAQLAGANLEGADLRGANLRKADLQGARLARADLTGAHLDRSDLRGANLTDARGRRASLVLADLRDADLSGANLQGADLARALLAGAHMRRTNLRDATLQDADLRESHGLLVGQIGGANCAGAKLPEDVAKFDGLANVAEASKSTQNLFTSLLLVCAYAWLTIASTTDAQLLNNSAPPSSRLPILGTDIPLVRFYAAAPLLLLCLYVYFHLGLQRLWEELAELPAVFPDGRPLDKKAYPWLMNVLVRAHAARLKENRSHLARWQARISVLLAWGLVPLTLLVLWGRYLRGHDWLVTALHIGVAAAAVGAGSGFLMLAASTLQGSEKRPFLWKRAWKGARSNCALVTLGTLMLLAMVSFGSIEGANPEVALRKVPLPQRDGLALVDPRHWVPRGFRLIGYTPFAHLDDVHLSTTPANWTSHKDETAHAKTAPRVELNEHEFEAVKGADLERRNLRYAMAYNAFLINSFLRFADLRCSDLRDADLRLADLRDAVLTLSNLREADLRKADLKRAEMTGARLFQALLAEAQLNDARLDGADLSQADLWRANLTGTRLPGALLVGTDLREADLTRANLRGAVLKHAQLDAAVLAGADLRGADLTDATGLSPTQLAAALIDGRTRLPDEFRAVARRPAERR